MKKQSLVKFATILGFVVLVFAILFVAPIHKPTEYDLKMMAHGFMLR